MKAQGLHFSITLLALVALPVQADIYKCADADGHVTYSNTATKNCKKLNLDAPGSAPTTSAAPTGKSAAKNPTPATFPKVDDNTQKSRDTDRRRILESEQSAEQKNFEQAKKELAEQEALRGADDKNSQKTLDRLQPFKDRVALHGRNLEAIRKEIANLR